MCRRMPRCAGTTVTILWNSNVFDALSGLLICGLKVVAVVVASVIAAQSGKRLRYRLGWVQIWMQRFSLVTTPASTSRCGNGPCPRQVRTHHLWPLTTALLTIGCQSVVVGDWS
jgi:hypothetical protein